MRKRFNAEEREIIRDAFDNDKLVEWRNGRHWHPATVHSEIKRVDGWDQVFLVNHANTSTVHDGMIVHGSPEAVRAHQD